MKEELNRIKELMGLINEQNKFYLDQKQLQLPSDYLGKGGGFERGLYGGMSSENYYKLLSEIPTSEIEKIRLIFPQAKWEEFALKLLKTLKVVTGVFNNLKDAINFVDNLKEKNVKVDEFVVGSHGSVGTLLTTQNGSSYSFNTNFLNNFKDILHPNSKVFFTACKGADYLDTLKDAAEKLNIGVYGSAGIYNYITNNSEKGFYWCSPQKFETPKTKEKINPISYNEKYGLIYVKSLSSKSIYDQSRKTKITINRGVFDNSVHKFESEFDSGGQTEYFQPSQMRNQLFLETGRLDINFCIKSYFVDNYGHSKENKYNPYDKKRKELENVGFIDKYVIDKIKSNEIIVEVDVDGKLTNIKSLPLIQKPMNITNEYLLDNNLCKKVSKSPISWI